MNPIRPIPHSTFGTGSGSRVYGAFIRSTQAAESVLDRVNAQWKAVFPSSEPWSSSIPATSRDDAGKPVTVKLVNGDPLPEGPFLFKVKYYFPFDENPRDPRLRTLSFRPGAIPTTGGGYELEASVAKQYQEEVNELIGYGLVSEPNHVLLVVRAVGTPPPPVRSFSLKHIFSRPAIPQYEFSLAVSEADVRLDRLTALAQVVNSKRVEDLTGLLHLNFRGLDQSETVFPSGRDQGPVELCFLVRGQTILDLARAGFLEKEQPLARIVEKDRPLVFFNLEDTRLDAALRRVRLDILDAERRKLTDGKAEPT